jgi:uncharacterized protein with GYD domain
MPVYVAVGTWTDQGLRNLRDTIKHADVFIAAAEQAGCGVQDIVWTTGPYDLVAIIDAPNDEAASALTVIMEAQGNVRLHWMRGYRKHEMAQVLTTLAGFVDKAPRFPIRT